MDRSNYERLQLHIREIELILEKSFPTLKEASTISDVVESKTSGIVASKIVDTLQEFVDRLRRSEDIRYIAEKRIIDDTKKSIEDAEKKYRIAQIESKQKFCDYSIGGLQFRMPSYIDKSRIPIMSYGVVPTYNGGTIAVFRYSDNNYVSCTSVSIVDSSDNQRTLSCNNQDQCIYGDQCRYYHDPLIWQRSRHTQKIPRTSIIKGCPTFGDGNAVGDQIKGMTFEQVRTFARYLAIMTLYVSKIAQDT